MAMLKLIKLFLELASLGGLIGLMAFITWTKMALGGVLAITGAFFPSPVAIDEKSNKGTTEIKAWNFLIKMTGGLRFGVVVAGLILLVGAVLDGHDGYVEHQRERRKELATANYDRIKRILDERKLHEKIDAGTLQELHDAATSNRELTSTDQK
jgi:hypothetical protein